MTVRDFMSRVDRRIFRSKIVRALASFGDTQDVAGAFFKQPREIELAGGALQSVAISFECHYVDELADLAEGDPFTVDGVTYRYIREVLPGGDESGLTIIELGEVMNP